MPYPSSSSSSSSSLDISDHYGLVNHGNTCFYNSVLQLLSVTRPLHALLYPDGDLGLPSRALEDGLRTAGFTPHPVPRRRVPALLAIDESKQRDIASPPLTDEEVDQLHALLSLSESFRFTLDKMWKSGSSSGGSGSKSVAGAKASSVSPKALLKLLAKKYDQFGDYEQQDAHELLRLLLDAMRMEEMDFIKKFKPNPPGPRSLTSSASTGTLSEASSISSSEQAGPSTRRARGDKTPTTDEHPWTSLVDVLWGGKLASMVVCEGCRHVSHTYEDFLDLSLPLRAEDAMSKGGAGGSSHRRSMRMRFMTDRWKSRSGSTTPLASDKKGPSAHEDAKDTILKGTTEDEAFGPNGVCDAEPSIDRSASTKKHKGIRPSSAFGHRASKEAASADEGEAGGSSSGGWGAWAASLGRSRSARPASAKPQQQQASANAATPSADEQSGRDAVDMPDMASLAVGPPSRPTSAQPLSPTTVADPVTANALNAAFEAKSRGSRDLLSALSNASRPSSRAASKSRDPSGSGLPHGDLRSPSPGVAAGQPRGQQHHHHHLPHLFHSLHPHHGSTSSASSSSSMRKEPSDQAKYIARVFSESQAPPSVVAANGESSTQAAFRNKVRADQADTGLVLALRTFHSSEVLSDANAFRCKRCWRRLNPAKGVERERMRRRRVKRGKRASGSEDSDDAEEREGEEEEDVVDVDEGDSEGPETPIPLAKPQPVKLVAPQAKRVAIPSLGSLSSDEESDLDVTASATATQDGKGIRIDVPSLEATATATTSESEGGGKTPVSRTPSVTARPSPAVHTAGAGSAKGYLDVRSQIGDAEETVTPRAGESLIAQLDAQATAQTDEDVKSAAAAAGPSSLSSATTMTTSFAGTSTSSLGSQSETSPSIATSDAATSADSLHSTRLAAPPVAALTNSKASPSPTSSRKTSVTSSAAPSATSSAAASPRAPPTNLTIDRPLRTKRSTQFIPRRALKRYLISELPPVLVFHLKRFQMSGGSSTSASRALFSGGGGGSGNFKKIDDVVTFPEWLDMAEWIAPPREEYDGRGRLKESSDPAVWARRQSQVAQDAMPNGSGNASRASREAESGSEREAMQPHGDGALSPAPNGTAAAGADLGRRPSKWGRIRARACSSTSGGSAAAELDARRAASRGAVDGAEAAASASGPSRTATPSNQEDQRRASDAASATASSHAPQPTTARTPLYRLYAVVSHHGATLHGGHYTSYVATDRGRPRGGAGAANEAGTQQKKSSAAPAAGGVKTQRRQATADSAATVVPSSVDSGEAVDSVPSSQDSQQQQPITNSSSLDSVEEARRGSHSSSSASSTKSAGAASQSSIPTPAAGAYDAEPRQWVHCSDTIVRAATLEEVLRCKNAYLLAYQRVE